MRFNGNFINLLFFYTYVCNYFKMVNSGKHYIYAEICPLKVFEALCFQCQTLESLFFNTDNCPNSILWAAFFINTLLFKI